MPLYHSTIIECLVVRGCFPGGRNQKGQLAMFVPDLTRKRGAVLINAATVLLLALAIGLFLVSIAAQFQYVLAEKHSDFVSWIEAVSLDGGMAVASLLALGLSRAGMSARVERLFIVGCAVG